MASARRPGTNEIVSTFGATGLGRDYTNWNTWETDTQEDLVTSERSQVLECYADAGLPGQGANFSLGGATTSGLYFRVIRAEPNSRHNGLFGAGVAITMTWQFAITENHSAFEDIEFVPTLADYTASPFVAQAQTLGTRLVACITRDVENIGSGGYNGFLAQNAATRKAVDCIAVRVVTGNGFASTWNGTVFNCTAVGCALGFGGGSTGMDAKNCLGVGNVEADFGGVFDSTAKNNASSDATAPGANSRTGQTFTFVDPDNDDYRITVNDTGAKEYGTDLSADADFAFDDDIQRQLWPATWSIGANVPVGGGGTPVSADFVAAIESLLTLAPAKEARSEDLAAVGRQGEPALEFTQGVSEDRPAAAESLDTVRGSEAVRSERLAELSRSSTATLAHLVRLSNSYGQSIEQLFGVRGFSVVRTERSGAVGAVVSSAATLAEALQGISAAPAVPVESLEVLEVTGVSVQEAMSASSRLGQEVTEQVARVVGLSRLLVENLVGLAGAERIQIESLGDVLDAAGALSESLLSVSASSEIRVGIVRLVVRQGKSLWEADGAVISTPDERIYLIAREDRTYVIAAENRVLVVKRQ